MSTERKELKTGYTTGTCAAAAAKAAALGLVQGKEIRVIEISLPAGGEVSLKISDIERGHDFCRAHVIKDAGDDPDVTHGLNIIAEVRLAEGDIQVRGGQGIGVITKPGLALAVGEPAINPVPRRMILEEVRKVIPPESGAVVTISAPGGELLAERTMNPRLGIVGGISILGTGGIVRSMSEESYRLSLVPQLDQALALGYSKVVLTPGRIGVNMAEKLGFPPESVIETSNFIGYMLEECASRPVEGVLLLGHLGKLVKLAAGIFHTLGRLADGRRETITAHAALLEAPREVLERLMQMNSAEESVEILCGCGKMTVFNRLAEAASQRAKAYSGGDFKVGTIMYSLKGQIVGYDYGAELIGSELRWRK